MENKMYYVLVSYSRNGIPGRRRVRIRCDIDTHPSFKRTFVDMYGTEVVTYNNKNGDYPIVYMVAFFGPEDEAKLRGKMMALALDGT